MPDFDNYLSPFSWRYGTEAMRKIWSETHKRLLWRQIWVALAETEAEYGLVTPEQVQDLRLHMSEVNLPEALEIESEIKHDLMAEIRVFARQCSIGGGIIHLGGTSADIEDNADVIRLREALDLLIELLKLLLEKLGSFIEKYAETTVMAFTHLQPAEPTTLGYRLAFYGQDLLWDLESLRNTRARIKGKGLKGAVGTGASYAELIGAEQLSDFESMLSVKLDLAFFPISSQVYPRKQDFGLISALSGMGASFHKFAFDLRLMQSPLMGEVSEPFGSKQVGSSAMPFKRNPVKSEKINSLARYLESLTHLAWENAANSLLERTLDDSANRRIMLPEACLAAEEILLTANAILSDLKVDETAIARNLSIHGPFATTERILLRAVKAGANRQEIHERIRFHTMKAWDAIQRGEENPLETLICQDAEISSYLPKKEIRDLMNTKIHTGDAATRALAMAKKIREAANQ
jgi:adenylosuccinate lyase